MKNRFAKFVAVASPLVLAAQVHAATVIDTATKTAITAGFTDLKDSISDLLGTSFPYIIGGSVLLAIPSIVKGLIHIASKK